MQNAQGGALQRAQSEPSPGLGPLLRYPLYGRVLWQLRRHNAVRVRFGFAFEVRQFEWASCDWYAQHGEMMPGDWKQRLAGIDAVYFGAVGWPATVPDHISLWGSLLKFRREFDQYINLRPARLFEGVPSPLANRKAGDIDFMIVRENTEGEYSSVGGVMYEGTEREVVMQQSIFSRVGTERVLKFAFELVSSSPDTDVTQRIVVDKIELDPQIEESRFAKPATPAASPSAAPTAEPPGKH